MGKKKYTEEEALKLVFDKIKPSKLPKEVYDKFRSYRNRYEKGTLKDNAKNHLLEFFGYISSTTYSYHKDKDQSK